MTDWIGIPVGALFALVPVFALRALVLALHRRGRSALWSAGLAALGGGLGLATLLVAAFFLQPAAHDPTQGFRGLTATGLDLAFDAFWVSLLGLPLAVVVAVRTHLRAGRRSFGVVSSGESGRRDRVS